MLCIFTYFGLSSPVVDNYNVLFNSRGYLIHLK